MFDHIIAGGCSFVEGDELENVNNRFVNLIAQHYCAQLHDFSKSGISNEAISHKIINGVLGLLSRREIDPQKTLVVINWSYIDRLAFYSSEVKGWFSLFQYRANVDVAKKVHKQKIQPKTVYDQHIHPSEIHMYYTNHTDPLYLLYQLSSNLHKTQTFLDYHKIKYVFSLAHKSSLQLLKMGTQEFKYLYQDAYENEGFSSFENVLKDIEMEKIVGDAFYDFSVDNNLEIGINHHPLDKAHKAYSDILIRFIGDLYDKKNT